MRRKLEAVGYSAVVAEPPPGPWIKAAAVNPVVEASDAEILVVHDADVWCASIEAAVRAVSSGTAWAVPHRGVHRLTEAASEAFMAGADLDGLETAERVTRGVPAGGILVARREALLEAPLDSRFVGWGQEDMAIGIAMRALFGRPWEPRRPTPLVHLWHPPQERLTRKWGSLEGRSLVRRYERARRDPDQMRRLLEEIPCP